LLHELSCSGSSPQWTEARAKAFGWHQNRPVSRLSDRQSLPPTDS
jgi:hypothetical protein